MCCFQKLDDLLSSHVSRLRGEVQDGGLCCLIALFTYYTYFIHYINGRIDILCIEAVCWQI